MDFTFGQALAYLNLNGIPKEDAERYLREAKEEGECWLYDDVIKYGLIIEAYEFIDNDWRFIMETPK